MTSLSSAALDLGFPSTEIMTRPAVLPVHIGGMSHEGGVEFVSPAGSLDMCDADDIVCGLPLMTWIESHYCVLDYGEVTHFLFDNHRLYGTLIELWSEVRSRFDTSVTILLEVAHDPEAAEYARLYASIVTADSSDKALALLDDLHESWWLDRMSSTEGKLNIGIRHLV